MLYLDPPPPGVKGEQFCCFFLFSLPHLAVSPSLLCAPSWEITIHSSHGPHACSISHCSSSVGSSKGRCELQCRVSYWSLWSIAGRQRGLKPPHWLKAVVHADIVQFPSILCFLCILPFCSPQLPLTQPTRSGPKEVC